MIGNVFGLNYISLLVYKSQVQEENYYETSVYQVRF
jgi:hypothetical protein